MTMLYVAEYPFPGHSGQLCDAIADALVEEGARREKRALCGLEVAVHRALPFSSAGGSPAAEPEGLGQGHSARVLPRAISTEWRPSPEELDIRSNLCLGPLLDGEALFREVSDDQSIVTGYAIDSSGTNLWNQAPAAFRERAVEELPLCSSAQPGVRAAAQKLLVHGHEYLCVLKHSASFAGEQLHRLTTSLSKVLQFRGVSLRN